MDSEGEGGVGGGDMVEATAAMEWGAREEGVMSQRQSMAAVAESPRGGGEGQAGGGGRRE